MTSYHLTRVSGNVKTGPIPVSTSSNHTCPSACPFKDGNGCYADSGPIALHWRKISQGQRGGNWQGFINQIRILGKNQLWRHNQAGDLAGNDSVIDLVKLYQLVQANKGKKGYTYTHKPVIASAGLDYDMIADNQAAISYANNHGFTINISTNSITEVDQVMDLDIGPVVTVLPSNMQKKVLLTEAGNKVLVCPAQTVDSMTCANCGLCQQANRKFAIGFLAHGTSKKKVNNHINNQ